jgi:hypothetical protein
MRGKGASSGTGVQLRSIRRQKPLHASVEIVNATLLSGGLRIEYAVRPVPAEFGSDPQLREGELEVSIDGVRCPHARSAYSLAEAAAAVVGTLSIPIRIQRSVVLHIRFAPLAHTVEWSTRTCEALIQVRVAEIEPISARWVRPQPLTAGPAE